MAPTISGGKGGGSSTVQVGVFDPGIAALACLGCRLTTCCLGGTTMRCVFAALLAALLFPTAMALANDTMAVGAAGGLVFVKSADVAIESEDLWISAESIRVRNRFRNRSPESIEALIAFPLPDIDHASGQMMIPQVEGSDNFVGFTVTVDGRPVRPTLEARAYVGPVEVTEALRHHRLPLSWLAGRTLETAIEQLPEAAKGDLAKAGILGSGEFDDFEPKWTLKTAYTWRQVFPPNRTVVVEHRYRPVVGGDWFQPEDLQNDRWSDFCLDDATRNAIARRLESQPLTRVTLVEYVLTTGANWAGPIGRFRLVLDKTKRQRLLSTCLDGLKRAGATTWTLERRNFTPSEDIRIMLIEVQNPD
jgi:hypothetical protein